MGRKTNKMINITEEQRSLFNKENVYLQKEFLLYLKSLKRSELTIYNYGSDLDIVWLWCYNNNDNKFFVDWKKRDYIRFQNYFVNEIGMSGNRYRRLRATVSSLSNFIENIMDEEYPNFRNLILKFEAPEKTPVRKKTVLEQEDIDKLFELLEKKQQYQKACLLALAICSGARKSELLRFKVDFFKDEYIIYGSLYKTPEEIKTKGRSGGHMLYKYTLVNPFKKYFNLWMKQREELGINSEWLFVSRDSESEEYRQMGISGADYIAHYFSRKLDIDFYWHSCRHLWTTNLLKQNLPSNVVQTLQGWKSSDMVEIYNDTEVDDVLGQYFDENGIKQVEQKSLSDL